MLLPPRVSSQIHCIDQLFVIAYRPLDSNASDLSVYTRIPQYMGIGLSEIFAMVATYEFAYYAARRSAKSLFMSLRFCLLGILSFVGALGVYVYPQITIQKSAVSIGFIEFCLPTCCSVSFS